MSAYVCQRPIHPGEILKEELEFRNLAQNKLASQIGVSYKVLNDILNSRRNLTTSMAMLIEAAIGISASLLMRIQLDYNMRVVKEDKNFIQRLEEIRKIAAVL